MIITLDGFHNREARDWYSDLPRVNGVRYIPQGGYRYLARKHAKKHGVAGAVRADDSFILFYRDFDGKIRQKTWKNVRVIVN